MDRPQPQARADDLSTVVPDKIPESPEPLARDVDQQPERRLRRVVIEEDQQRKLAHARQRSGYAEDVSPHAHNQATFKLINQRKELDQLPGAEYVVPQLDKWKFWTKMNDWDSRNQLLEALIAKVRRREVLPAELQLLVIICAPTWWAVTRSLRRYGGVDLDPRAEGRHQREEARRVNELDRDELDQVVQHALLDALNACPRPLPRRFFPWLKQTLAHRALDYVCGEICEHKVQLEHDPGIKQVLAEVLGDRPRRSNGKWSTPRSAIRTGSTDFPMWVRTLDLPSVFELANEYASYARIQTACHRAVDRLPGRQRQVVQDHYFNAMTQADIAAVHGLADSTVRNTHSGALRNLRGDNQLFDVLEAVGKVRDQDRRLTLRQTHADAA